MKTFLQFRESTATQQAARLGLVTDGHGGWTDRTTGEFVANLLPQKVSIISLTGTKLDSSMLR